jgi:hypothetical protein
MRKPPLIGGLWLPARLEPGTTAAPEARLEPGTTTVGDARLTPATTHASVVRAWEMIEPGRYMPRRTRGSFPGRELG